MAKNEDAQKWWKTTPAMITAAAALITAVGGVALGIWKLRERPNGPPKLQPAICAQDKHNLLNNCGFEEDLEYWGTGIYEGIRAREVFWTTRKGIRKQEVRYAAISGKVNSQIRHSGERSFKIINNSPLEDEIYGTMSQKINNLQKNTLYTASFWVKAERAKAATLQITTDLEWKERVSIRPGTYDWVKLSHQFKTGDKTSVDFRIISVEPGTVWIDDIVFNLDFASSRRR
ncbi:carbohydrate binding domain-containing protein [Thermodesulfobacteriota bacterium]